MRISAISNDTTILDIRICPDCESHGHFVLSDNKESEEFYSEEGLLAEFVRLFNLNRMSLKKMRKSVLVNLGNTSLPKAEEEVDYDKLGSACSLAEANFS